MFRGLLIAALLLGPPPATEGDFNAALADLETAQTRANNDPEAGMAQLQQAVEATFGYAPQLAHDQVALDLRLQAQLNLARAYQRSRRNAEAEAALREAARMNHGVDIEGLELFGPKFAKWAGALLADYASEGYGSILTECECFVYVDERVLTADTQLPMGSYRVWLEPKDWSSPPEWQLVELTAVHRSITVRLAAPLALPVYVEKTPIAPVWLKGTLVAGGIASVIVGGIFVAVDGRCVGGGDPMIEPCAYINRTTAAGAVVIPVGIVGLGVGIAFLGVDAVRQKKSGRKGRRP